MDSIFINSGSVEEVDAAQKNEAFYRFVKCATRSRIRIKPKNCQTGDEVYLISGSRVPIIL